MRIRGNQVIGGLPAFTARDLMNDLIGHQSWRLADLHDMARYRRAADPEAVTQALLDEGYIEQKPDGRYRLSALGDRLHRARGTVFKRTTADRAVAALVTRAEEINRDPDFMYWVNQLIIFGSYLDAAVTEVGDVDVAVELERKPPRPGDENYRAWEHERRALADRKLGSLFQQVVWPTSEVLYVLKGRSPVIQFDRADNPILANIPTRVVYDRAADARAAS